MTELDLTSAEGIAEPYTKSEARAAMNAAWGLLREDAEQRVAQGLDLLAQAQRRQAGHVLGYPSWNDLLRAGISANLRTTCSPHVRRELAVELRRRNALATRDIARAFQVSHSTIVRDLQTAREAGKLDGEPELVTASNGRILRSSSGAPRRADLVRAWRSAADDIVRRTRTISDLCRDDRYPARRGDLTITTRSDLTRARDALTAILNDFDVHDDHSTGENI